MQDTGLAIRIVENTQLFIRRKGEWYKQYCPWGHDIVAPAACGGWCPFFKEPQIALGSVTISLCKTNITVPKENFEDMRKTKGDDGGKSI